MDSQTLGMLRVPSGAQLVLADRDPHATLGWEKASAAEQLDATRSRLADLQYALYAEGQRALLVVLQAMDASGKDGTIRRVMTGFNPAGVHVQSFKAPTGIETAHDYLWRVHAACPALGRIGVFNRSHYEDVLVVRVKELVPEQRWQARYDHIVAFEEMLAEEGTALVKIFLHISFDEQRVRLQDRLDDPSERWKFRAADLDDRKLWPQYMQAYEEAISRTSRDHAPWYVVPANRRWVRNLAVARILEHTMDEMNPRVPTAAPGIEGLVIT